jgi:hypothetical protein
MKTRCPVFKVNNDDYFAVFRSDAMLVAAYNPARFPYVFQFFSPGMAQNDKKVRHYFFEQQSIRPGFFGHGFAT